LVLRRPHLLLRVLVRVFFLAHACAVVVFAVALDTSSISAPQLIDSAALSAMGAQRDIAFNMSQNL
jgi:hypothetical protein